MIDISPTLIKSTIAEIEAQLTDPSRTEQSKIILVSVIRTLHWVLAGGKGQLIDNTVVLCSEQVQGATASAVRAA